MKYELVKLSKVIYLSHCKTFLLVCNFMKTNLYLKLITLRLDILRRLRETEGQNLANILFYKTYTHTHTHIYIQIQASYDKKKTLLHDGNTSMNFRLFQTSNVK